MSLNMQVLQAQHFQASDRDSNSAHKSQRQMTDSLVELYEIYTHVIGLSVLGFTLFPPSRCFVRSYLTSARNKESLYHSRVRTNTRAAKKEAYMYPVAAIQVQRARPEHREGTLGDRVTSHRRESKQDVHPSKTKTTTRETE